MKDYSEYRWKGTPITELNKEELMDAFSEMYHIQTEQNKEAYRQYKNLREMRELRRQRTQINDRIMLILGAVLIIAISIYLMFRFSI